MQGPCTTCGGGGILRCPNCHGYEQSAASTDVAMRELAALRERAKLLLFELGQIDRLTAYIGGRGDLPAHVLGVLTQLRSRIDELSADRGSLREVVAGLEGERASLTRELAASQVKGAEHTKTIADHETTIAMHLRTIQAHAAVIDNGQRAYETLEKSYLARCK